jgi:hypothetical protein
MMQARESFTARRPSRLLRNPAARGHDQLHATACCQVDRRLLIDDEKTIGDEIHKSLSRIVSMQCKIDARTFHSRSRGLRSRVRKFFG